MAISIAQGLFVGSADLLYVSMGASDDIEIREVDFLDVELDSKTFITTLTAGYRAVDQDRLSLDVFGGGRLYSMKTSLDLEGPQRSFSGSKTETWLDPVVGLRFKSRLGQRWSLEPMATLAASESARTSPGRSSDSSNTTSAAAGRCPAAGAISKSTLKTMASSSTRRWTAPSSAPFIAFEGSAPMTIAKMTRLLVATAMSALASTSIAQGGPALTADQLKELEKKGFQADPKILKQVATAGQPLGR